MRVICTHEQADFDALAALIGAAMIYRDSYAIMPARLNRNVRNFLNLYGSEFPLKESDELPKEAIGSVILVDTQSLISLKGLQADASITVFDHHPARPQTSSSWNITCETVGACTTIFVEMLAETGVALNNIPATLLLLGIYEDTGSLTYSNTTVRDVNAVAFLLEQGANIKLVSEFLNPPLSDAQRKVYDQLLANVETLQIEGSTISIASADAHDLTDEVSSIAHKVRDLLDPDGLFLLIQTRDGLRMVSRSTSDHIHAARIMGAFQGGGHERAASALIKPDDRVTTPRQLLEATILKLKEILRKEIQPSRRVSEIMSPRPHTITSKTSVEEAYTKMQRYGYEGFPVVDGDQIKGLLTRRAVDRARLHKLNLTAASLMDSGAITVHPSDSIDTVQDLMAESGWGQIPVTDQEHRIVGIVTRTDLLKVLASNKTSSSEIMNLSQRLEQYLPIAKLSLLKTIIQQAKNLEIPIYLVGGFVRDLILNIPSSDFDLVTEGDAILLARNLASKLGGAIVSHARFGTAKWRLTPQVYSKLLTDPVSKSGTGDLPDSIDLISARMETYDHPTALPTVEHGNIKMDLHRRDFTINTLALRLDEPHYGEIVDFWGGLNDLRSGLIRILHSLSFIDDPTRMLRAIRFEQRFHFQLEGRTGQLLTEALPLLQQVSGSRVRHELDLILSEQDPVQVLGRLKELGLLAEIHPDLTWNERLAMKLHAVRDRKQEPLWDLPDRIGHMSRSVYSAYLVWLGEHPLESALKVANRLRLPGEFQKSLRAYNLLNLDGKSLGSCNPSAFTHRLEEVSRIVLFALECATTDKVFKQRLVQYRTQWSKVKISINGGDLKKLGLRPGPAYRRILESLKNAWIDGKINSPSEEQKLLRHLVGLEKERSPD